MFIINTGAQLIIRKLLKLTYLNGCKNDSLESMIYIICLIMFADKRIRKGELVTLNTTGPGTLLDAFEDSLDSINSGNFNENLRANLDYSDFDEIETLQEIKINCKKDFRWFPSKLLIDSAANKIQDTQKQKVILLGAIRMAACDLHISPTEDRFIKLLAKRWKLEKLLIEVMSKLPDWERKRTKRIGDLIQQYKRKFEAMIEDGSISARAYQRIEESIALQEPILEMYDENKELYKYAESENESLQAEKMVIDKQFDTLTRDYKKAKQQLKRLTTVVEDQESIEIWIKEVFTKLELHHGSTKVLEEEYPLKKDVLIALSRLNFGKSITSKRVRGTKGWREIAKIKTGNPNLYTNGRIYFKSNKNEGAEYKYKVFVSVKKNESDQKLTIDYLRNWH